jgi:hypothetical protein
MTAFAHHLGFELRTGTPNPMAMLHYLFPLGFYVPMGLIMLPINPDFARTMVPALIVANAALRYSVGTPRASSSRPGTPASTAASS